MITELNSWQMQAIEDALRLWVEQPDVSETSREQLLKLADKFLNAEKVTIQE